MIHYIFDLDDNAFNDLVNRTRPIVADLIQEEKERVEND